MRGLTAYMNSREPFDHVLNVVLAISLGLFGYVYLYNPNIGAQEPADTNVVTVLKLSKISSTHTKPIAEKEQLNPDQRPTPYAMRERILPSTDLKQNPDTASNQSSATKSTDAPLQEVLPITNIVPKTGIEQTLDTAGGAVGL